MKIRFTFLIKNKLNGEMIEQFVTLVSPNWYCPSSAPNISSRATVWSLSDISFNSWAFRTPYLDQKDMTPLRPLSTLSNICAHTHNAVDAYTAKTQNLNK